MVKIRYILGEDKGKSPGFRKGCKVSVCDITDGNVQPLRCPECCQYMVFVEEPMLYAQCHNPDCGYLCRVGELDQ